MEKLAQMPGLAKRMAENGHKPVFIGPPGSREYVFVEVQKWRKVMKESALKHSALRPAARTVAGLRSRGDRVRCSGLAHFERKGTSDYHVAEERAVPQILGEE